MYVVIIGKEKTEQVIKNVVGVSMNKNVMTISFEDAQGLQHYEREMKDIGGMLMGHDLSERRNLSTAVSGEID